jgi:hypothetical protein
MGEPTMSLISSEERDDGDGSGPDSARTLARAAAREERRGSIARSYATARRAIDLARAYRADPRSTRRREEECLAQVAFLRRAIASLRAADRAFLSEEMPGLHKALRFDSPAAPLPTTASGRRAG